MDKIEKLSVAKPDHFHNNLTACFYAGLVVEGKSVSVTHYLKPVGCIENDIDHVCRCIHLASIYPMEREWNHGDDRPGITKRPGCTATSRMHVEPPKPITERLTDYNRKTIKVRELEFEKISMESSSRYIRASQAQSSTSLKHIRSGYEPSDTETDWQESRDHYPKKEVLAYQVPKMETDLPRSNTTTSPLRHHRRHASKIENDNGSGSSPKVSSLNRRHSSKSPYKTRIDDNHYFSPISSRRNISPLSKSERRRHVSPYKLGREELGLSSNMVEDNEAVGANKNQSRRTLTRDEKGDYYSQLPEVTAYSRRSKTAPRLRTRQKDQQKNNHGHAEQRDHGILSPLSRNMIRKQRETVPQVKATSVGELNEMVALVKISKSPRNDTLNFESTESISPGDIFFSREVFAKNGGDQVQVQHDLYPRPTIFSQRDSFFHQHGRTNGSIDHHPQKASASSGFSRVTLTTNSAVSRQSSGKLSSETSKVSDASGKSTGSSKKFAANRRKSQSDAWFSCMRKGTCRRSKSRSPPKRAFDEASFIEKAIVVENLRQFWVDKHQPNSLNGFTCHKHEAQLLQQLVSEDNYPHILFKGPSGSGKRALAMALLREIYGDTCWNISHDLRCFPAQDKRPMQVFVPVTSSAHHVELNVNLEPNAKSALMGLVKEIRNHYDTIPEVSIVNFKTDYKAIVLYEVDQAGESIQHLIKWIMDCYSDACKLILCCEDDVDIIESVKNRCNVIKVDAPVTHEIMEILIQIAKKEDFELSMSFAAKIATKSKQNLRKAIMALEACKAHNYPFADDQPIALGWEEVLIELGAEILADPSPKRLFLVRGKIQKLLVDFVHPKLILLKLVEEFLKGVEGSLKREIYYWHAYYDKRLPTGTSALLKLEEFVAKFMSVYRKGAANRQYM
ncbi:hypothetical protein Pint_28316 [Pistacia integerrima]|uniref:Uncharacterized protein n=1 Tax=Pistacia integerrima TaxID=434235 RepID=A0ACC0YT08_9ROSI|nr:hypothetical protein Pint_28316 [Pistacia integerrima]